jgi:cold-inducible RNA-binding protein
MSKKLYIGNLPYSVTETALREMFTPVGVVDSVSIITDRDTGRPKGFAFVEMTDDDAAKQAISQINGKTLDNRLITVAEARPQEQRFGTGGRFRSGSRGGGWGRR